MEEKYRKIHFIVEIILAVMCFVLSSLGDVLTVISFTGTTIYNVFYLVSIRKKTGETMREGIMNILLIWAILINVITVVYSAVIFFAGHTYRDLFGNRISYGFDAWKNNIAVMVLIPCAIINFIYIGIYMVMKRKRNNKG